MEQRKHETFLDLDRIPTREELRRFFTAHDWTVHKPFRFDEWDQEKIEDKRYTQDVFNKVWGEVGVRYGQKAPGRCYSKNFPLEVIKKGAGDTVAGAVAELVSDHPDIVATIFDNLPPSLQSEGMAEIKALFTGEEIDDISKLTEEDTDKADEFVAGAVDKMFDTFKYGELVEVCKQIGTPEDFSNIMTNYPRSNFEKKYNHTDANMQVVFSDLALEVAKNNEKILNSDYKELAESSAFVSDFFDELDETECEILKLLLNGKTQKEIAEELGFKTHSAISKKMIHIREKYLEFDPEYKERRKK